MAYKLAFFQWNNSTVEVFSSPLCLVCVSQSTEDNTMLFFLMIHALSCAPVATCTYTNYSDILYFICIVLPCYNPISKHPPVHCVWFTALDLAVWKKIWVYLLVEIADWSAGNWKLLYNEVGIKNVLVKNSILQIQWNLNAYFKKNFLNSRYL